MKALENLEDIKFFVDTFYSNVMEDDLIGPIFAETIEDWKPHLEKMYAFWNAALFGVPGFRGHPFAKHAPLPIGSCHFERWLLLFKRVISNHFAGEKALEAVNRAELMASMFISRLSVMKGGPGHVVY